MRNSGDTRVHCPPGKGIRGPRVRVPAAPGAARAQVPAEGSLRHSPKPPPRRIPLSPLLRKSFLQLSCHVSGFTQREGSVRLSVRSLGEREQAMPSLSQLRKETLSWSPLPGQPVAGSVTSTATSADPRHLSFKELRGLGLGAGSTGSVPDQRPGLQALPPVRFQRSLLEGRLTVAWISLLTRS